MLKAIVVAGLLLSAAPAAAQTQAQSQPAAPAAKPNKDAPDKVICRSEEQIGSRLASKRVCMTATQWKEHQLQTQRQLDQLHMGSQSTPGPG